MQNSHFIINCFDENTFFISSMFIKKKLNIILKSKFQTKKNKKILFTYIIFTWLYIKNKRTMNLGKLYNTYETN